MSRFSQKLRTPYCRQPVQHMVLDVGHPMTSDNIKNTVAKLLNVLSLACSLRGGARIQGFGFSTINNSFETLYKTTSVKGNFSKIDAVLNSLGNRVPLSERLAEEEFCDCINLAIQSIIEEFKTNHSGLAGGRTGNFVPLLQITLITRKDGLKILEYLETMLQNIDKMHLKKIQVAEIISLENECDKTSNRTHINIQNSPAYLELIYLDGSNNNNIEDFFKTWLFDCDKEHEHLHLLFPGISRTKIDFSLKCDITESIVNTISLPFGHRYQIQTTFFSFQFGGHSLAKNSSNEIPIYELEAVACISLSGLCESLLFGFPLRLHPTQCWRIEWEEIMHNQQCFEALCQYLLKNELYLLTRLKAQHRTDQVFGYFILIAGEKSLLLKAVASAELTLPSTNTTLNGEVPETIQYKVSSTINKLPLIQDFQPNLFASGLYTALNKNLRHFPSLGTETNTRSLHPALDGLDEEYVKSKKNKKTISQKHINEKNSFVDM